MGVVQGVGALLGLGIIVQAGFFASPAHAEGAADLALQIYGLALDDTRLGHGFCERRGAGEPVRRGCATSQQALPTITNIHVQTTPAPHVRLTLVPDSGGRARDVRIWYAPPEEGGRSFMIATTKYDERGFESARNDVLDAFGPPAVAFSHADMEARGIHVSDFTVDTLIYVDRSLPDAEWARIAHRLQTQFKPTGAELFSLTNARLHTLARLLGSDFRGAIVQVSASGWTQHSTVRTILLDLKRAQSIFRLDG